ncbi:hypothetical protein ACYSNW_01420 [Enterococcus sp. LJL99]
MKYEVHYKYSNKNLFIINNDETYFIRFAILVEPEYKTIVSNAVIPFLIEQDKITENKNVLYSLEMIQMLAAETFEFLRDRIIVINDTEQFDSNTGCIKVNKTNELLPMLLSLSIEFFQSFIEKYNDIGLSERLSKRVELVKRIRLLGAGIEV